MGKVSDRPKTLIRVSPEIDALSRPEQSPVKLCRLGSLGTYASCVLVFDLTAVLSADSFCTRSHKHCPHRRIIPRHRDPPAPPSREILNEAGRGSRQRMRRRGGLDIAGLITSERRNPVISRRQREACCKVIGAMIRVVSHAWEEA